MQPIHSFAPIEPASARVLILGSMPGQASLNAQAYYAHPRNAFWPIMAGLLGFSPSLPYNERVQQIQRAGIGVWDVMAACIRPSSLDSAILPQSIQPHDFSAWFARHPATQVVFCNGGTAWKTYQRAVLPQLSTPWCDRPVIQLPSTSPAHARLSLSDKTTIWIEAIRPWLIQS
ncbi:DNA-deoxyinosine glycosylase [Marinospirillum sp.]|uniref:DNA-deoxyinosine glycosylase n=1 Tax=Marinospirillum sp. TaxID=2183934 RepID=UPI003A891A06